MQDDMQFPGDETSDQPIAKPMGANYMLN
jgi:hypothetical protein